MNEAEKERLIKKDIESIENRVRHAFNQGYEMGLKENKEQSGDAISREAVLNIYDKCFGFAPSNIPGEKESLKDKIKALPPVTLQTKTGRWIPVGYDGYADGNPVYDWWECSECGWEHTGDEESLTAFCPNCGSKMEVEE